MGGNASAAGRLIGESRYQMHHLGRILRGEAPRPSRSKAPDAAWAFMRYLISEEASKTYVDMQIDGLPVHKAAADLVLKDARPPKSKQIYIDAYKYAKPAFTTPYGQRAKSEYNNAIRPLFLDGGQVRPAVMEAMPKITAALEEEVAADTKK